ncbi:hypothetical protein SALBM135S_04304 [Streptomyces alboniger]
MPLAWLPWPGNPYTFMTPSSDRGVAGIAGRAVAGTAARTAARERVSSPSGLSSGSDRERDDAGRPLRAKLCRVSEGPRSTYWKGPRRSRAASVPAYSMGSRVARHRWSTVTRSTWPPVAQESTGSRGGRSSVPAMAERNSGSPESIRREWKAYGTGTRWHTTLRARSSSSAATRSSWAPARTKCPG